MTNTNVPNKKILKRCSSSIICLNASPWIHITQYGWERWLSIKSIKILFFFQIP
jgi:hypothetical protein